jgi:hypothetical protein
MRVLVQSHDPTLVPNVGIRSTISDWPQATFPNDTSFQVGAEETIGNYTAVFGLFQNTGLSTRPFFSIFAAKTDALVRLTYWNTFPAIPGASYDFRLVLISNTTWTLSVNGFVFAGNSSAGSFNFGAREATNSTGIGFSEVAFVETTSPVPANLSIPVAFAVLKSGTWGVPQDGYSLLSPASPEPWGLQGRTQNAALAPDELWTGAQVPLTANNTTLWSGGSVPVNVSISASASTVAGTAGLTITVMVTSTGPSSVPLGGVAVTLQDDVQSTFSPVPATTSPDGTATFTMVAGNVSQPTTDLILAAVALIGYSGSAAVGVVVTPPLQVLLKVTPSTVDLSKAATLTVTVDATYTNGSPAQFVQLTLSVTGPASVEPVQGLTTNSGTLGLTLSVAGTPGQVVLTVTVTGGGAWGRLSDDLGNHPSFNFFSAYGIYLVLAAVGVLAVVAAWFVIRHLRGRHPIPPMGFRANQETPLPPRSSDESVSHRPPEEGTP